MLIVFSVSFTVNSKCPYCLIFPVMVLLMNLSYCLRCRFSLQHHNLFRVSFSLRKFVAFYAFPLIGYDCDCVRDVLFRVLCPSRGHAFHVLGLFPDALMMSILLQLLLTMPMIPLYVMNDFLSGEHGFGSLNVIGIDGAFLLCEMSFDDFHEVSEISFVHVNVNETVFLAKIKKNYV